MAWNKRKLLAYSLETPDLRSRCQQGWMLLKYVRNNLFHVSYVISGGFAVTLWCISITPISTFIFTWHSFSVHWCYCSVTQSCPPLYDPIGLHARLPCPSPSPWACSNACPLSQWCQPTISSSVVPFSSCLQSCPAPGSFPMSEFFTSGGQSIRASASASVLLMNIQDWFPLARRDKKAFLS